jgi:DNA helicase-2/ATP-dependent DNA helicase PcrA
MEDEGLTLPLVQISGNEKGVNLLTVHGSKAWSLNMFFLQVVTPAFGKRNGNRWWV